MNLRLGGEGDFDFNSGFQGDRGLRGSGRVSTRRKEGKEEGTHDLLDDFGGRVQVDQSLVDSHFVLVPGLGTFTTGAGRGNARQRARTSAGRAWERKGRGILTTFGW